MTSQFFSILVKSYLSSIFFLLIQISISLFIIFIFIIIVICKIVVIFSFHRCLYHLFFLRFFRLRVAEKMVLLSVVGNTSWSCFVIDGWLQVAAAFHLWLTVIKAGVLIADVLRLPLTIIILFFPIFRRRSFNIKLFVVYFGLLSLVLPLLLFLYLLFRIWMNFGVNISLVFHLNFNFFNFK